MPNSLEIRNLLVRGTMNSVSVILQISCITMNPFGKQWNEKVLKLIFFMQRLEPSKKLFMEGAILRQWGASSNLALNCQQIFLSSIICSMFPFWLMVKYLWLAFFAQMFHFFEVVHSFKLNEDPYRYILN
jgi:hypothetical protein